MLTYPQVRIGLRKFTVNMISSLSSSGDTLYCTEVSGLTMIIMIQSSISLFINHNVNSVHFLSQVVTRHILYG